MDYFHYTSQKNMKLIVNEGLFPDSSLTTSAYYNSYEASHSLGVPQYEIEVVLKFSDDFSIRPMAPPIVPPTNRYIFGGATQFANKRKIIPKEYRLINSKAWKRI